ncbi:unnamed protein product, partial [marine sediment metagenome]
FIDEYVNVLNSPTGIISSLGEHNNVLALEGWGQTYNNFAFQTSGTFECWIRGTDVSEAIVFVFRYGASIGMQFEIDNNKIKYYYAGAYHDATGGGVSNDIWYHLRVDFECGDGEYKGLAPDTYDFYLNGTLLDSGIAFRVAKTSLNKLYILMSTDYGIFYYLDAIGYDWDTNYDVGDNINSHGSEVIDALENEGWDINVYPYCSIGINGEFNSHKKSLEFVDNSTTITSSMLNIFTST